MKDTMRIGTIFQNNWVKLIKETKQYGFECYSLAFWEKIGNIDLKEMAKQCKEAIGDDDIIISTLSLSANPLSSAAKWSHAVTDWERMIDAAQYFGTNVVTGFTGRVEDVSIDKNIPKYTEVFSELAKRAEAQGVKIAFENCGMGGNWYRGEWNIAHDPVCWEMMFNAVNSDVLGLEWEPCHQMCNLIDPIPQLRKWAKKMWHIHGKDATVKWDVIKEYGIGGKMNYAQNRTPGFGDSNWADIISILRENNFKGTIDIEGYHDPVYRGELEMMGQVRSLNYLKECRGGTFYPYPEV